MVTRYELILKALPFFLGIAWSWWVLTDLRRDIGVVRNSDDNVGKAMIILAWALTPIIVFLLVWFALVLMRDPHIGFE